MSHRPAAEASCRWPLAFTGDTEAEIIRLQHLRVDDPIALQDAFNTSAAMVEAVKAGNIEELREVIENASQGEIMQAFVLQAFVAAIKAASLDIVQQMLNWGVPLGHAQLSQALHLVCEITDRDNFSSSWRIVELLTQGNGDGKMDINAPRAMDGWTPLCIACAGACLPLAFKLLELGADPNIITRENLTPLNLVRRELACDSQEQKEARGIIGNMLRHYGGQDRWQDALARSRRPKANEAPKASIVVEGEDGTKVITQVISKSHTRFSA